MNDNGNIWAMDSFITAETIDNGADKGTCEEQIGNEGYELRK
jgi:hypothetical protein